MIFIPKTCKIGWQARKDTFNGKLSYIIYYDEKGVLRKEKSWEGWRDKDIEPQELDNSPFDGFILNKGIQRCNYDHFSSGRSLVRVYDSRLDGIEFEVSIDNLLYILMHDDCTKRELMGKYVYAWQGTELILLPVSSEDYEKAMESTRLRGKKFDAANLVPGHTYTHKDGSSMTYIGKYRWFDSLQSHSNKFIFWCGKIEKYFYPRNGFEKIDGHKFYQCSSLNNVAEVSDESIHPDLAEFTELFFKSEYCNVQIINVLEETCNLAQWARGLEPKAYRYYTRDEKHSFFEKVDGGWNKCDVRANYETKDGDYYHHLNGLFLKRKTFLYVKDGLVKEKPVKDNQETLITRDDFCKIKTLNLTLVPESGKKQQYYL